MGQFTESFPIIVHSHLCWDWVWQRPQQFLSRLSRRHKVLFVETLAPAGGLATPIARYRTADNFPNVTILSLQFPVWVWSDAVRVDAERRRLVQDFMQNLTDGQFENAVQWFYDPMAVTAFAGHMGEALTIYDCMDELSQFRGAPPEIAERERELLRRADVVFTGGRNLYEHKSQFHNNCHFYGCGVDGEHFGRSRTAGTVIPPEVAVLPRPVLGYFGVVDERIDYDLLAALADADPCWSVVMIGPVLKVDPKTLPQRSNLHWLGQRAYADLPACAKGFDLCLMPFALNESTEFINPTKALEYMATGRPIVSTAVSDVVRNFGSIIKIAVNPDMFVAHCQEFLERPDAAAITRGFKMVREHSWDSIVAQLETHVIEALSARNNGVRRVATMAENSVIAAGPLF